MSRREALNEPAPQRRNPRRFVGESYRDCVDRLAGELTAAEMDRDALQTRVAELEAENERLRRTSIVNNAYAGPEIKVEFDDA